MERRAIADRRQVHMFFADDRRSGPHDRRGADSRRKERAQQVKKIQALRAYKEKNRTDPTQPPMVAGKRLMYVGVALLILIAIVLLAT